MPFFCIVSFGISVPSLCARNIQIAGSTTVYAHILKNNLKEIQSTSNQDISVDIQGSGKGLISLIDKKADIAIISTELSILLEKIWSEKIFNETVNDFECIKLADAQPVIIANKDHKTGDLSTKNIIDILTGKITNWKDVGGDDRQITVICENEKGGIRNTLEKKFLQDSFGGRKHILENETFAIDTHKWRYWLYNQAFKRSI
jgi:phosphate transport system substrate-binding protein